MTTFKIRDRRGSNRYFVDNVLLRGGWGAKLGPYGIAAYNALALHVDADEQSGYPSYTLIAKLTGMSERQAIREIAKLEDYNIICKETRFDNTDGSQSSNEYVLLSPAEWKPIEDCPPYDTQSPPRMTHSHPPYDTQSPKQNPSEQNPSEQGDDPQKNKDYLDLVLSHRTGQETIAEPDNFQKYFGGYRDPVLKSYNDEFGLTPNQGRKQALIDLANEPKFDWQLWAEFLPSYNRIGGNPYNIELICEAYWRYVAGSPIRQAVYPDSKRSSPEESNIIERNGKTVLVIN